MSLVGCWSVVEESLVLCVFSFCFKKKKEKKKFWLKIFFKKKRKTKLCLAWRSLAWSGRSPQPGPARLPSHSACQAATVFLIFFFKSF